MTMVADKARAYRQQMIEELTPQLHLLPTIELVRLLLWTRNEARQGHDEQEICKTIARRAKKGKPQQQRFPELRTKMCDPATKDRDNRGGLNLASDKGLPYRSSNIEDGVSSEKPPDAVVQDLEKTFRPAQ